jgi:hypothetical protein
MMRDAVDQCGRARRQQNAPLSKSFWLDSSLWVPLSSVAPLLAPKMQMDTLASVPGSR